MQERTVFNSGFIAVISPQLRGQLQRGQRLFLHKESQGEEEGQWVQVVLHEVSSQDEKKFI